MALSILLHPPTALWRREALAASRGTFWVRMDGASSLRIYTLQRAEERLPRRGGARRPLARPDALRIARGRRARPPGRGDRLDTSSRADARRGAGALPPAAGGRAPLAAGRGVRHGGSAGARGGAGRDGGMNGSVRPGLSDQARELAARRHPVPSRGHALPQDARAPRAHDQVGRARAWGSPVLPEGRRAGPDESGRAGRPRALPRPARTACTV